MIPEYVVKLGYFLRWCNICLYLHTYIHPSVWLSMWIFKGLIWESLVEYQAITLMNSNSFKDQTYYICFWVRFLWLLHLVLLFGYVPCFLGVYIVTCMCLCFLTLHFSRWNLPGVLWPAGLGMALGFSVLAAVAWRAEVETPLMERMAVYVGYVLDPHQNLKMVTLHGKGNASFFFVQLNDHVQVPFFFWGGGSMFQLIFFLQNIYV